MDQRDPGLELHEWETRWAELDEMFHEDPAGALPEACDFVEQVLGESGVGTERNGENDELVAAYEAARETADTIERDEDVDSGDVAAAIENVKLVYDSIRSTRAG